MNIIQAQQDLLKARFYKIKPSFIEKDDCISLQSRQGCDCCIDKQDRDLALFSWSSTKGYFYRQTSRSHPEFPSKTIYLHRLILERVIGRFLEVGEVVDHINWDRQNNKRSNLRIATKSENACNSKPHCDSSIAYKGVSPSLNRFQVRIQKTIEINESGFETPIEAAIRYDELAAKYHGKFASFNFPQNWELNENLGRYVRRSGGEADNGI